MAGADLLEREGELARIAALLEAADAGAGGALVVAGEAGIGKTALLRAAAEAARARRFSVLTAAGGTLETEFPFGVARQLLEAAASPEALAGAAAAAAPALGLRPVGDRSAGVSFELRHGLYWLTANLAERSPLLLVVDDAQWADTDSLGWLVYLARRLDELPVALLVAAREGEPSEPLAALRAEAAELSPEALSLGATAGLVLAALGTADGELCAACREASGGNPFLLGALLDELGGGTPSAADVHAADPAAVQHTVPLRVARFGPAAVGLAQAVAILERDADLGTAGALAELPADAAQAAADALIAAHVLAPEHPLRFAHPMLRAAVYGDVGLARRAAGHRRAAELLDARAPDRAALHLLAAHPAGDPWVLDRLRAAARRTLARGSPDGARALLERALAEAPAGEARAATLLELGDAEGRSGSARAAGRLEEALGLAADPALRMRIARRLASVLWTLGRVGAAEAVLDAAIREHAGADMEARLALEADRASFLGTGFPARLHPGEIAERVGRRVEELPGDTPAERRLLATLAFHRMIWGQTTGAAVADLARRALAGGRLVADAGGADATLLAILSVLQFLDRDDEAETLFAAAVADRPRGAAAEVTLLRGLEARRALFRGELRAAEAAAREAVAVAEAAGLGHARRFSAPALATVLVERGELEAAELALAGEMPYDANRWMLLQTRAALRRAQGRFAEALEATRQAHEERSGPEGASVLGRATLALALHAVGREAEATEQATESVAHARRWGVPSTLGMALRVQGLVAGDPELLRAAADILRAAPRRLEHARALVDLGAALRRANRRADAREPLAAGMELAHRCGAGALAGRAREELVVCGARPRRLTRTGVDALTPSELRVAQLAASGLTNREIAQALFVTRKTVETHLAGVYRKLGVNAREELAAKLQGAPPDANPRERREAVAP